MNWTTPVWNKKVGEATKSNYRGGVDLCCSYGGSGVGEEAEDRTAQFWARSGAQETENDSRWAQSLRTMYVLVVETSFLRIISTLI